MNEIDSHDIGPNRTFRVNKSHVLLLKKKGNQVYFLIFSFFILSIPILLSFFVIICCRCCWAKEEEENERSLWLQQFRIINWYAIQCSFITSLFFKENVVFYPFCHFFLSLFGSTSFYDEFSLNISIIGINVST